MGSTDGHTPSDTYKGVGEELEEREGGEVYKRKDDVMERKNKGSQKLVIVLQSFLLKSKHKTHSTHKSQSSTYLEYWEDFFLMHALAWLRILNWPK